MNILETVGKYAADYNRAGLMLVFVPKMDLKSQSAVESASIYTLDGREWQERRKLREIRDQAVAVGQLRVLFILDKDDQRRDRYDVEADVVLHVKFDVTGGVVKVRKARALDVSPKDTYFLYEA